MTTPKTAPSARQTLERSETEDGLLTAIVEAALFLGWKVHHDRRSDKALQQGSPGFPDLVLARRGRVLFIECKAAKGRLTEDQWAWAKALGAPSGVASPGGRYNWWSVFPADLDAALAELSRG